ncbi:pentapeptide repeat-containing protein [Chamaesiphon sp.]|uniref:pentapeptide repeat-containing protein n=1 Tax=Chamaesiphon sp. TaxID=2814140 RepID=UPI003594163C
MVWQDVRVEMTPEDLVGSYMQGIRDFRGIKLIHSEFEHPYLPINLRELCLSGANLSGADLTNVDLTGADLTGANLFGAVLTSAHLIRAIFRDVNFYGASLHWCGLNEADLLGSNLSHINATSAWFNGATNIPAMERAIFASTDFTDAQITKQLICRGGNLIWRTIMPDGEVVVGPQYGDGHGR